MLTIQVKEAQFQENLDKRPSKKARSRFPIGSSRELLRPLIHGEKIIYISSQLAAHRVTWKEVWFI